MAAASVDATGAAMLVGEGTPANQHEDSEPLATVRQEVPNSVVYEIAFVDTQVQDYQQLVDGLNRQSQEGKQIEVVLLDAGRDGIQQISEALQGRSGLDAIHIFSHGIDGAVELGDAWLNAAALETHADAVAQWGAALNPHGDLLLYGCDVAADAQGQAFVNRLAQLTGADVAASRDATGSEDRGANWSLEYVQGPVDTVVAVSLQTQQAWDHVLALTMGNSTSAGTPGASSLTWSHTIVNGANRLLIVSVAVRTDIAVSSVTYGGSALTQIGFDVDATGKVRSEMWYLKAPAVGTDDVIVSLASSANFVAGATDFFEVDQTTPFGSVTTGNGSGEPSLTVASAAGEWVIDAVADRDVDVEAVGPGQAVLWVNKNGNASNDAWGGSSVEPGAASVTMSWTTTGAGAGEWAAVAISLKPYVNAAPTLDAARSPAMSAQSEDWAHPRGPWGRWFRTWSTSPSRPVRWTTSPTRTRPPCSESRSPPPTRPTGRGGTRSITAATGSPWGAWRTTTPACWRRTPTRGSTSNRTPTGTARWPTPSLSGPGIRVAVPTELWPIRPPTAAVPRSRPPRMLRRWSSMPSTTHRCWEGSRAARWPTPRTIPPRP